MPLSEREQRILEEIERNLVREDPRFARMARAGRRFDRATRARAGIVLFVAGLCTLVGFFMSRNLFVGVGAFGAMVAGIALVLGSIPALVETSRREGRAAMGAWSARLDALRRRLRDRYRRR